jgi:dihydrofolate synthase / folylpolyglutamate synthase
MDTDPICRDRASALAFLLSRIDYERSLVVPYGLREFKLDRMRELLARMGNPQASLAIVHVAGTKGKGSTAAMIAAALTAAGYRTGLFTSPHMARLEERVNVDGCPCSSAELVDLVARLRPIAEGMDAAAARATGETGLTYFELTTAMALMSFAGRSVDAAVLEVGMGGRLDSTNVCDPLVSVITSISFDHTQQLGNSLAEIAAEKAGIIKPGVPVISGVVDDEPRRVIRAAARAACSPLRQSRVDFDYAYHPPRGVEASEVPARVDVRLAFPDPPRRYDRLGLSLLGRHQAANAAVAVAALAELETRGFTIAEFALRRGLSSLVWPARVEVVARRPTVVVDAAHNAASVSALLATLDESFSARERVLVFATTRDKDVGGMLPLLLARFDHVILTRYASNPRGVPLDELAAIAASLGATNTSLAAAPAQAWDAVRARAMPDDLVCVTGSFYIAGEMRREMAERPLALGAAASLESA